VFALIPPDVDQLHGEELSELYNDLDYLEVAADLAERRITSDVPTHLRAALNAGERELIVLLQQRPSTVEIDGEPLSILAAAATTARPCGGHPRGP